MRYSENWTIWKTNVGWRTCEDCLSRNGRIFSLDELIRKNEPPLHPNCRCQRIPMRVMKAGMVTKLGTNGADWWLKYLGELPEYYIPKEEAENLGWDRWKGNLAEVLPGCMICGTFENWNGILPQKENRVWYEADINYQKGRRNNERIVYSNDGLIFATFDHYQTFVEIVGEEI